MSNPVDINNANLEELQTLTNIGEKRAEIIINARKQKKLTLEDLKQLHKIPCTIWDPLVFENKIVFGEVSENLPPENMEELKEQILKLQTEIKQQQKEISQKDRLISQCERDIETREKEKDELEKQITDSDSKVEEIKKDYDFRLKQKDRQHEFEMETVDKFHKEERAAILKQKEEEWEERYKQFETRYRHRDDEFASGEVIDRLAPNGIYKKYRESEHVRNSEGPLPPKMSIYDGKNDWKPFFTQFSYIASRYNWTEQQRLDKLIECLRDKALKFFSSRPSHDQQNYSVIIKKLGERFGKKDLPHIIRRQLQDIHQNGEETIDEFSERVLDMTVDGYPNAPDECIQTVAIDAFLKGCSNKQAALLALDKNPLTLDQATQHMKSAVTNQRLILGTKQLDIKRVTFENVAPHE